MIPFLLIILTSCSYSTNWLTYTDHVNHFELNYPDSWTKQNAVGVIAFLSPKENDKDLFQENVNLMLQDLSQQPMDMDQYTELTKKQITDNLGASAIVSLKNTTLAGQKAKEFIYNMDYQGRILKIKQYWFIKDNIAFLFTYTAEPAHFDTYEKTATDIIQSFKFFK